MTEFLMQPPVIAAIIAIIGAAIIVPLFKKLYFDVQNRLRVDVRAWKNKMSGALKKTMQAALDAKGSYVDEPIRRIIDADGYMMVTITNISKKKISGVSIMIPDWTSVCQIDDADELIGVPRGQVLQVGDIQPKHSRVIHIWSDPDTSNFTFARFKHSLWISADELDDVRLRFPIPDYLRTKYEPFLVITVFLLLITAFFVSIYLGLIH